jgi:hypothetical protein
MTGSRSDGFRLGIYVFEDAKVAGTGRVMEYTKAYDDRETAEQPSR